MTQQAPHLIISLVIAVIGWILANELIELAFRIGGHHTSAKTVEPIRGRLTDAETDQVAAEP